MQSGTGSSATAETSQAIINKKMKHLKNYLFALGCLTAVGLTSCLEDVNDENTGFSRQEISECFNTIKGNYTGKLLFEIQNPNDPNDYVDTLDITWSVTADTLIVINQFPQATFLEQVQDSTLKAALAKAAPESLKANFGFYNTNPIAFMVYPIAVNYDIMIENVAHKATLAFWYNNYSFGSFDLTSRVLQIQMIMSALYLDESISRNYLLKSGSGSVSIPLVITNADLSK